MIFPHALSVLDEATGKSLEYRHLIKIPESKELWIKSFANELGRLAQGVVDREKGTDTIKFIKKSQVPKHKTVTYGRIVVAIRPEKKRNTLN